MLFDGLNAARIEYERRLSLMPGPLQDCYESAFFLQKCENAIDEIVCDVVRNVTLEEFTTAGQHVTLDPEFMCGPTMSIMTRIYSQISVSRLEAILALKWVSALHLEQYAGSTSHYHRSCLSYYYHYNVLQLPLECDLVQVRRQYDNLCARWSTEGTDEQIKTNLAILTYSYDVLTDGVTTICSGND